ncbi:MAG TPA: succinate dehydrogenase, cytochrome b556 subunit [Steroidobacteraceae bacterium]|nr:succinate dehydrogenase, cytochrome b556 subunit [Steroidobacteraceae bacterium]
MLKRPLSPHLEVYKLKYTLIGSGMHRLTGLGLSAGFVLLVYWLMAVAGGARANAHASRLLSLPVAKVLYALLIIAFSYHLLAGIRHLIWDTGRGLERKPAERSAWLLAVASVVLSLVLGCFAWLASGRTP